MTIKYHDILDAHYVQCRCLAHRAQDRLDVEGLASHPYMALKRGRIGKDAP